VKIIEIANAIPKAYQDQLESELGSDRMTWTFHEEIARSTSKFKETFSGFSHSAYLISGDETEISPMSSLLLPVLFVYCEKANIPFNTLLRIRVGLFTKNPTPVDHHNPHVDFSQPHHTAVYYVNDSDGDTVVFNQTFNDVSVENSAAFASQDRFTIAGRVAPRKGTMMSFDGAHYHASMHPMKAAKRIAITFNFV